MSEPKDPPINFEKSLAELEQLVSKMEQGELPLEETLKQFERGIKLTRHCEEAIARVEQRVELLLSTKDGDQVVPFDSDDDDT